jgi:hypothetical protein
LGDDVDKIKGQKEKYYLIACITCKGTISQKKKIKKAKKENKSKDFSDQKNRKSQFLTDNHRKRISAHHPPDF